MDLSTVSPPIPESTSSKTKVSGSVERTSLAAKVVLANSPPDATLFSGSNFCPELSDTYIAIFSPATPLT